VSNRGVPITFRNPRRLDRFNLRSINDASFRFGVQPRLPFHIAWRPDPSLQASCAFPEDPVLATWGQNRSTWRRSTVRFWQASSCFFSRSASILDTESRRRPPTEWCKPLSFKGLQTDAKACRKIPVLGLRIRCREYDSPEELARCGCGRKVCGLLTKRLVQSPERPNSSSCRRFAPEQALYCEIDHIVLGLLDYFNALLRACRTVLLAEFLGRGPRLVLVNLSALPYDCTGNRRSDTLITSEIARSWQPLCSALDT
jgi:hypothetical protein